MKRARSHGALGLLILALLPGALVAQTQVLEQIRASGTRENRLNLVILSEGYTSVELTTKFPADAVAAMNAFLNTSPYRDYAPYLNVFTIAVASPESGSDHPSLRQFANTYFNSSYDSGGLARFLTIPPNEFDGSYENGQGKVDALLAQYVPDYDQALLVVNDTAYGGSGDGTLAVVSVNVSAAEVALHESGHSLGVLTDEYEDPAPVAPFEAPNSTQETNRDFIRWNDWILASTLIPTPETPGNER